MARIPENFTHDLLARTDLVELIDARVPLKKTGRNYSACCPFHQEKTPSFTVAPDKQFSYCFACGASGNAVGFLMEYEHLKTKKERTEALKKDPFYNALQVKFAYAVTCHKSQGGQWPAVFVDQGYLTEEMLDTEYLRWLYTAITRASEKLYLLNFSDQLFSND